MEKKFCEVVKNSSLCNFRERMATGSTLSMSLIISVEVSLTYIERIKWFGSLSQCWRLLPCEITWFYVSKLLKGPKRKMPSTSHHSLKLLKILRTMVPIGWNKLDQTVKDIPKRILAHKTIQSQLLLKF